MGARLIQVIETDLLKRGKGVDGDPIRLIRQYWSTDGELLAEVDEWPDGYDPPVRGVGIEDVKAP